MTTQASLQRKNKNTKDKDIDKEVLEMLPYWVHEMLKMIKEAERVKAKKARAPSTSSSGTP
ncbi:MAG: hypothetical protein QXD42_05080 [Nitrososphaerales archaeon]